MIDWDPHYRLDTGWPCVDRETDAEVWRRADPAMRRWLEDCYPFGMPRPKGSGPRVVPVPVCSGGPAQSYYDCGHRRGVLWPWLLDGESNR